MLKYALPIAFQQLIFTLLNLVANVMVGQLGATALAAVGLAGQIFFLLNLLIFGIGSGAAMFTAQLWGKRDIANIHKVVGLALTMSLAGGLVFLFIAEFFSASALGVYTNDPSVIVLGSSYLRIFGFSFIFFAVSATFSLILRSVGEVHLPVIVSVGALGLNIVLSYCLIFGKFGFPQLGINGAAVAIVIARILECIVLVTATYIRKLPPAARLKELFNYNLKFAKTVLTPILPVAINEILWSFGITAYQAIYAHIGTDQFAAINIAASISDLAVVAFMGIGNATAIMVGNTIGAGKSEPAQIYGGRSLVISALGGIVVGIILWLISPLILSLYRVAPDVIVYTKSILLVTCLFLWLRMMNMIQFIGIFRAGGDTRFALVIDGLIIWVVGVPLAAIGAFVLQLPIYLVYALTMSEEIVKWALGLWRYFSKKWIHDLTEIVPTNYN